MKIIKFKFQCPKVLLEYGHAHSFIYCFQLQQELSSCNRDPVAQIFIIRPFREKTLPTSLV